jgi:hypothetical protein
MLVELLHGLPFTLWRLARMQMLSVIIPPATSTGILPTVHGHRENDDRALDDLLDAGR